jgi:amidase
MSSGELWRLSATDAVAALRKGDLHPHELIEAAIGRIEAVDDAINALPIRCFERAFERAKNGNAAGLRGDPDGLAGLPIAVKDYNDVGGVRTTYGSPIYADHVPTISDATVARLESRGAIPIAKSNVPEWAGGHTFNPVHGITRNPWNTGRSAGGSSGGSAAALASGQVWLATGNDLGGSLRTPAGFNGIVGLRPGPGVVPRGARLQAFDTLWVEGPMARNVADVALMLDAGAGHDPDDPLSFDPAGSFVGALDGSEPPVRVAFSPDLGIVPIAREISDVATIAVGRLANAGVDVTEEVPDFTGALDAFQTLRAVLLATMMGELLENHRDRIAGDIVTNVQRGFRVTPDMLFQAERVRWGLYHRMTAFFETHDLLICPSASIPAFPVEQSYVTEIDGTPCETYIDWFAITFALTMTSCPVVSIPCAFTTDGLPVGLQIVGKPRGEAALLGAAKWIEDLFGVAEKLPIDPRISNRG